MGENVRTGRLAKGLGPVASRVSNEQGHDHEDVDEVEVQDGIQDQDQPLSAVYMERGMLPIYIAHYMWFVDLLNYEDTVE